jgi:hypothetical protein
MGMPLAIVRNDDGVVWDVFLKLPNLNLFSNHWNPDQSGHCAAGTTQRGEEIKKAPKRALELWMNQAEM